MSKLQFVKVEGYSLHYHYLNETGECEDYAYPVIGLYVHVDVDDFGFTEKVLTMHGWVKTLKDSATVSLQCPDGSFTDGLEEVWENKEKWLKEATETQAARYAHEKMIDEKRAAWMKHTEGSNLRNSWCNYVERVGVDEAMSALISNYGVGHVWDLSETAQADLNFQLVQKGY